MAKKSKRSKPPVQPASAIPSASYAPNDPKAQALFRIRLKRWLCIGLIFAFLPICTALARFSVDLTAFAAFGLLTLGYVLFQLLNRSECPRCGGLFFIKKAPDGKLVGSGLSFPPINQCQGCGQSLQG